MAIYRSSCRPAQECRSSTTRSVASVSGTPARPAPEVEGEIDSWLNEDSHVDQGWVTSRTSDTDSRPWGTELDTTSAYGAVSLQP